MADKDVGNLKVKLTLEQAEFDKGIKSLSRNISVIDADFKLATASLDKVKNAMQIAELRAKSLSDKIVQQRQIVEQFTKAHAEASAKLGAGSNEALKYEASLKKSQASLIGLENALKETNKELGSHNLLSAKATDTMNAIGASFDKAGQKMTSVGKSLSMSVTAPILAAGAGLLKLADSASKYGDEITGVADRTGLSIQKVQELKYVTSNLDVEFGVIQDTMTMMVSKMKGLDTESSTYSEAMKELGVNTKDSNNQTKSAGDIYTELLTKLSLMTNETDRGVLASKLFGKSWVELNPLLNAGADGIAKYTAEAHSMGLVLSDEAVIAADQYEHSILNLKAQFTAATVEIAGRFMPIIQDKLIPFIQTNVIPALKSFGDRITDIINWFENLDSGTQKIIGVLAGIVVAAGPLLVILGQVSIGIGALVTALTFLAANPVVLAIAAIVLAIGAIVWVAGDASRAVQDMTNSLMKSYQAEADTQKAAIDASYAVRIKSLNDALGAEDIASDQRIETIQTEYDAAVKGMGATEKAMKKSLSDRKSALDKSHSENIKRIQDEYGVFDTSAKSKTEVVQDEAEAQKKALDEQLDREKTAYTENIKRIQAEYGVFEEKQKSRTDVVQEEADAQKDIVQEVLNLSKDIATQEGAAFSKTYDAILAKASDIHDEKLRMYEEEYLKSVSLINQDLAATIGGLQGQIDAIDSKTSEEDRIAKEQDNRQKILDLQVAIREAKTYAERDAANKALAVEINRQNQEKERIARQIQIDSLNKQIQTAIAKAAEDKQNALAALNSKVGAQTVIIDAATKHTIDQIQAERIAKEAAETAKLAATTTRINNEKTAIDAKALAEIAAIQRERIAKEAAENAKYNAAVNSLDNEEAYMEGWSERYKAQLDANLKAALANEALRTNAIRADLQAELDKQAGKVAAEKAAVDKNAKVMALTSTIINLNAEVKAIRDKPWINQDFIVDNWDIIQINKKIIAAQQQLHDLGIPGFASGVTNWQGGLARVNEKGGEIRILERGTTVIPNDISQQIAKAVGANSGNQNITIITNTYLDGKVVAQTITPYLAQSARQRGRAVGVMG